MIQIPDLSWVARIGNKRCINLFYSQGNTCYNIQENATPNCSVFSITTVLYHHVPCPHLHTYSIGLRRCNKFSGIKGFGKGFGLWVCTVGSGEQEYAMFHAKSWCTVTFFCQYVPNVVQLLQCSPSFLPPVPLNNSRNNSQESFSLVSTRQSKSPP